MGLSYNEIYELCKKFRELGKLEAEILDFLWFNENHNMTYTSLARMLGKNDNAISNVRKAVINLYNRGIIFADCYVVDDNWEDTEKTKPITHCYLVDGWMEILLHGTMRL